MTLPSATKHRAFYERWIQQHRNVEKTMGILLAVEEDAIRRLESPPKTEGSELKLRALLAKSIGYYEGDVREAIRMRNAVEAALLSTAPKDEPVPKYAPRGT